MRAKWLLPLALVALALPLVPVARSQDGETETVPREGDKKAEPGWRGLPGAKDPGEPGKAPGWKEVALKLVPASEKGFDFRTPHDAVKVSKTNTGAWIDVTNGTLPLVGALGQRIRFEVRTAKIMLDFDGCGQLCREAQGEVQSVRVKCADGSEGTYVFRLRRDGDQYFFSRAFAMTGKIDDTPIALVDEDNSGAFGDVGADAVRVGSAPCAQYMSEVLNVKNKLYCFRVNQAGSKAWYKPFEGPTGWVDVATNYAGKSHPLFVMLKQGQVVIDVAHKDTLVPAGTWALYEGLVGPTMYQSAKILPGKATALEVKQDRTAVLAWGMPGVIEFSLDRNGNQLHISSSTISIYGQGGEQYVNFRPHTFTPDVQVVDNTSKRDVMRKNMGAGC
jgi:hypothetical protein